MVGVVVGVGGLSVGAKAGQGWLYVWQLQLLEAEGVLRHAAARSHHRQQ